jgi:hypothetical protein
MQHIAEAGGGTYIWVTPEGIYPAMAKSLDFVPAESYVWWINSSDWLAGTRSIQEVSHHLIKVDSTAPLWIVGQLIRRRSGVNSLHRSGSSGDEFVARMRRGTAGLPHPATIFWLPAFRDVSPYEDNLRVASDYSAALRFAREWGSPVMCSMPLSVHTHTGFSARHPLRNFLEKAQARWQFSTPSEKLLEPLRTMLIGARASANLVHTTLHAKSSPDSSPYLLGTNTHFCDDGDESTWPICCDHILEQPFT